MDPRNLENIRDEEGALDESLALNKIVIQLLEERKKELKHTWNFIIVLCIVFVVAFVASEYAHYKEKSDLLQQFNDTRIDFMEYLDSIEYETVEGTTTTTETTQSVEGDSAVINNGSMEQYNDSATHNDYAGGE